MTKSNIILPPGTSLCPNCEKRWFVPAFETCCSTCRQFAIEHEKSQDPNRTNEVSNPPKKERDDSPLESSL